MKLLKEVASETYGQGLVNMNLLLGQHRQSIEVWVNFERRAGAWREGESGLVVVLDNSGKMRCRVRGGNKIVNVGGGEGYKALDLLGLDNKEQEKGEWERGMAG